MELDSTTLGLIFIGLEAVILLILIVGTRKPHDKDHH